MSKRVQVVLEEEERELFRQIANDEGLSLSAWLREAGRARAAEMRSKRLRSPEELRRFFSELDENDDGVEPDWEAHERVIERSIASGSTDT